MKTIRIGYQGDKGSNAEEAAKIFGNGIEGKSWIEYIPLYTSENVLTALQNEEISLGVVAVVNSLGGTVSETKLMMDHAGIGGWSLSSIDEHVLPVHHCLFTKSKLSPIRFIASHEQALKQTRQWCKSNHPDAGLVETIDTAYAARMLAQGVFSDDVAVICRRDLGEELGLTMRAENIEDDISYTTFHLMRCDKDEEDIEKGDE